MKFSSPHLGFPLSVTPQRRTALVDDSTYLRGLVEAVIFTRPGERVNRPEFGSGIHQLVFAASDSELAQSTSALVHGALQRALGELMRVEEVAVQADDATLAVTITYLPLLSGAPGPERRSMTVTGGIGAGP